MTHCQYQENQHRKKKRHILIKHTEIQIFHTTVTTITTTTIIMNCPFYKTIPTNCIFLFNICFVDYFIQHSKSFYIFFRHSMITIIIISITIPISLPFPLLLFISQSFSELVLFLSLFFLFLLCFVCVNVFLLLIMMLTENQLYM